MRRRRSWCSRTRPVPAMPWARPSTSWQPSSSRSTSSACRWRASASASTRPTCGAPATRSRARRCSTALLDDCDRRLGPDRLAMLHLNDSKAGLGSRLDRHEHIGAGRIGEVGLRHLVTPPAPARRAHVPRDAGHGRGLRRGQHGPRPVAHRGRAAATPATRGVQAPRQPRRSRPGRRVSPASGACRAARIPPVSAVGGIIRATARGTRALAGVTVVRSREGESGAVRGTPTSRPCGTKRLYERSGAAVRLVA